MDWVAFKNSTLFTTGITKINVTTIGDTEELDLIIPVYGLLEYSLNYSDNTGSLWFYSKDEAANFNNTIAADDDNFKSFKYKTKLIGSTAAAMEF